MKKYAKLKLLMLIPLLKLVVCFSITDNIVSTVKLFADDTSIFSAANDAYISADERNKHLQKISELNKSNHPKIYFNNAQLQLYHINEKISKAMKGICIIRKLNKALPQPSLITIYKSFAKPHLDYSDIIYDQPNRESLNQEIERIQ